MQTAANEVGCLVGCLVGQYKLLSAESMCRCRKFCFLTLIGFVNCQKIGRIRNGLVCVDIGNARYHGKNRLRRKYICFVIKYETSENMRVNIIGNGNPVMMKAIS